MSVLASAVPDDIFVIAAHKLVSLVGYYVRKKRYVCTDWPQRYEDILVIGAHEPLSHVLKYGKKMPVPSAAPSRGSTRR